MLASAVMDQSAIYLNDVAKNLYTYAAQVPYLMAANQELEMLMLRIGADVQRVTSATINVDALAIEVVITGITDFLLPIRLFDRERGSSSEWTELVEGLLDPNTTAVVGLTKWEFRNNKIYIDPSSTNREVKVEYERALLVLDASGDALDFTLSKNYLAARTAELCARYIGMNKTHADDIKNEERVPAQDQLESVLVLNLQGTPTRRRKFSTRVY